MKTTITTIQQLKENKPRFCLSAKRPLGLCWQCEQYPTCESKVCNPCYDKDRAQVDKAAQKHADCVQKFNEKWPID